MARTITIANLVSDIRYQADIEGQTDRHSDSQLKRLVNESFQELKELLSDKGYPFFLKAESGQMTSGEFTPDSSETTIQAAFGTIDFPADAMRIYGVDITYQGRRIGLEPVDFTQRNDIQDVNGSLSNARPKGFYVYNIGAGSGTSTDTGKIALMPAPQSTYDYTIYYLPYHVDITTDTHVFHVIAGMDTWVKWDVVIKVWQRDQDTQPAVALQERERQMQRIIRIANGLVRAGPKKMVDSRGRHHWNDIYRSENWP